MKLLVLYQATDPARDHPGYFTGFERMVAEGQLDSHIAVGYLGEAAISGWDALWKKALRLAQESQADAVFFHFFHVDMPDPTAGISAIRNLPHRPLLFSSLGDPFGQWTKTIPRSFRVASRLSEVSFLTGMGYLAQQLAGGGSKNLVLMPNGCCQVRFSAAPPVDTGQDEFDISFIGSRIRSANPLSHYFWVSRRRVSFVEAFTRRYGKRFGLFGKGWEQNPSWQGPVPYAAQHQVYRRSSVVLGGMPNADHDYYTSDRAFIAVASGVPLVDYRVRGVDRLLTPGVDWWLAEDLDGMFRQCDLLLGLPRQQRIEMAHQTRHKILSKHTQYDRCVEMIDIVRALIAARQNGSPAELPVLPFLQAPENSLEVSPPAVVAWKG